MREPLHASSDLASLPVYDADEIPIGCTYGVLAEADSGLVRFFDVALEGRQRHVLIPVGHARVEPHMNAQRLRLRAATVAELERIPPYEPHTPWSDEGWQNELLESFGRLFEGQRYYAHPAYDHTGLYAGMHPLLRDALAPASPGGLRRLCDTPEFKVAEGNPDIRGWPVHGPERVVVGRVSELIIDADAGLVRYVVVRREVDDAQTLLPIGYVELAGEAVHCPLDNDDLLALPEFSGDVLERSFEAQLRAAVDARLSGQRRYLRPDFRHAA